ncbi:MAG TPA: DUF2341 domain-containing protein [Opitutaceae bacterium]|nr:DUF2341 domain-containing protein [Opitutaceae bacterium]
MKRATTPAFRSLLCGLLFLLACATPARAWWNADWTTRKKITIDAAPAAGAIADPVGPAVVLVRLHDGNFQFASAKPDGSDLRFVAADDRTPLAFHIEKFDSLLNEAFVWVKVPDVKPGAQTTFWLYYGNGGNSAARIDDPKGTYEADTPLVYHFAERGTPAADASGQGNNAQAAGLPSEGAMIGGGLRLDGKTPVVIPASASLAWTEGTPMTWSAWVKFGAPQANAVIFSRAGGSSAFVVGADNGSPFVEITNPGGSQRSQAATPITANSWHHVAVVADAAKVALFLDGEPYATLAAHLPALDGPMVIGSGRSSGVADAVLGGGGFVGEMDELQIAKTARAPGAIKFAAIEQGGEKAAKLLVVGEDEQPKSWLSWLKGGYVGIIISSLSLDGWVVIGVLVVMSIVSWVVMIGKARYLNRVGAGNERFLREWRHVATDLSVLDHADDAHAKSLGGRVDSAASARAMRDAPLFRVYHVGVGEIRHRLTADRSTKVLSARSIQAIRAALDGALVRETHRLGSQMVLLTIAISGGPFLGLLGTVVGVMITFAAVAAAGDVNVNAIAPGIAAALAATVAGLAVAIPALFGYNYLLTRVKAATSDMHVFIDEFVAKMAEFYSDTADANRTITKAPFAPSEPVAIARK